ncbi:hypothetical protein LX32DRAFT_308703 [Colletotrichum zoysiae]|uniref:Uncharacterized protein n=1 Tax=Colletotrichum zoysiae TaxID=1216348 RepID=A0AAD9HVB9_9PEZI|nr:hypothetical protein LX32DRAFT_308703 [Colletotrichum zoysiae]
MPCTAQQRSRPPRPSPCLIRLISFEVRGWRFPIVPAYLPTYKYLPDRRQRMDKVKQAPVSMRVILSHCIYLPAFVSLLFFFPRRSRGLVFLEFRTLVPV